MRNTRRIDPPPTRRARATLGAVAALALIATAATVARAASVLDFDVWMRAIDKRSVEVQRNIDARKTDAAVADAQELARLYGLMETYFVDDGHFADAVEMSRSGRSLASIALNPLSIRTVHTSAAGNVTVAEYSPVFPVGMAAAVRSE